MSYPIYEVGRAHIERDLDGEIRGIYDNISLYTSIEFSKPEPSDKEWAMGNVNSGHAYLYGAIIVKISR